MSTHELIKLDIGSADGPQDQSYIHIDREHSKIVTKERGIITDDYQDGFRAVDIIADANHLPIRDRIIDEIYSGRCIFIYTKETAYLEVLRVLKPSALLQLRLYIEAVPEALRLMLQSMTLVTIRPRNRESTGEIIDVFIEALNIRGEHYDILCDRHGRSFQRHDTTI